MCTFITLLVTLSSVAFAQTEPPKSQPNPKAQTVTFDGTGINGERELPSNTYVSAKRKRKFDSLIQMRANFNDKLANSVEAL